VLTIDGLPDANALDQLDPATIPQLITQLGEDGLDGQLAAWALGQLGAETAVRAALPEGRLDTRQNGYQALAVLAALGKASADLGAWLVTRIDAEIAKAKSGGTGLAEQAARPLAILGHPQFAELIQRIIEGDRFCDRFELDRLRSEVADSGKARFLAQDLSAPWRTQFADHLPKEAPAPAPEPAPAPAKPAAAKAPAVKATTAKAPGPKTAVPSPLAPPAVPAEVDADAEPESDLDDAELAAAAALDGELPPGEGESDGPKPEKVDWKAFAESEEFKALNPQSQGLVTQLGPLLEQLAAQAIRAFLTDLQGQEFAALLLQVLPQALQPQAVQMALHPHALNGYQALAKFLARTGAATQGDSLVQGVKLVRQQLRDQMRKSGMLGGPDYSDPDEAQPAKG
jgi:hypothetical protein